MFYEIKAVTLAFLVFGGGSDRFIYAPLMAEGGPLSGSPFGSPSGDAHSPRPAGSPGLRNRSAR